MEIKYSEMVCREIVEKQLRPLLNQERYAEMIAKWGEIVRDPAYTAVLHRKANIATILGGGAIVWIYYAIGKYIGWDTLGNSLFGSADLFGYVIVCIMVFVPLLAFILSISQKTIKYILLFILISCTIVGTMPFWTSADCQRVADREIRFVTTTCSRTILGKVFSSSHDEYTELYQATHPEQFRSSSSSSDSD
jgi:hypothetical protein